MRKLIVSGHPGAIEFIRATCPDFSDAEVKAAVRPKDVAGSDVIGDLPLHLVALCGRYRTIEFAGNPPRGAKYGAPEMREAGANLVDYTVLRGATNEVATWLTNEGLDVFAVRALFPYLK